MLTGPVAARRETIAWLERRPLHGRRVVVTRARAQASGLAAALRALGAEVVELPAIRIVPRLDSPEVRDAVQSIHAYALVCLTSPNGVRLLFDALAAAGRDARALANATVAAIGPGTAAALAERGIRADVVPERSIAEALVESLRDFEVADRPVLVARAAEARDVLPDALRERGAKVDVVALYETVAEQPDPAAVEAAREADYVTFTSSSTVRNFIDAVGGRLPERARVVSIGPVTSEAAREAGLTVDVEADRHDPDGLVEALVGRRRPRARCRTWRRPITFLSDYGYDDEFAGVCRAVIARIAPEAKVIDLTHGIPRHDVRQGAAVLANALPFAPPGVHSAVVDPEVGTERRAVAVRVAEEDRVLVGPDNGLLWPAIERLGGAVEAVDVSLSPLPARAASRRPSTAATSSPRWRRTWRRVRTLREAGERIAGGVAGHARGEPGRSRGSDQVARTRRSPSTGSATRRSTSPSARLPETTACGSATPLARRERSGQRRGGVRAHLRGRRRGASCCSTWIPTGASRWRSTAAARRPSCASSPGDEVVLRPQ